MTLDKKQKLNIFIKMQLVFYEIVIRSFVNEFKLFKYKLC